MNECTLWLFIRKENEQGKNIFPTFARKLRKQNLFFPFLHTNHCMTTLLVLMESYTALSVKSDVRSELSPPAWDNAWKDPFRPIQPKVNGWTTGVPDCWDPFAETMAGCAAGVVVRFRRVWIWIGTPIWLRRLWIIPSMMVLLFSTPSLFTSNRRNARKVSLISCSVTFPKRTNMAKANISLVHSSNPSLRAGVNRSRWINNPVASSRSAASSSWSPNYPIKIDTKQINVK